MTNGVGGSRREDNKHDLLTPLLSVREEKERKQSFLLKIGDEELESETGGWIYDNGVCSYYHFG
jgi:hypothetical protein